MVYSVGYTNGVLQLDFTTLWRSLCELFNTTHGNEVLLHPIQLFKISEDYYDADVDVVGLQLKKQKHKYNSLKIPTILFKTLVLEIPQSKVSEKKSKAIKTNVISNEPEEKINLSKTYKPKRGIHTAESSLLYSPQYLGLERYHLSERIKDLKETIENDIGKIIDTLLNVLTTLNEEYIGFYMKTKTKKLRKGSLKYIPKEEEEEEEELEWVKGDTVIEHVMIKNKTIIHLIKLYIWGEGVINKNENIEYDKINKNENAIKDRLSIIRQKINDIHSIINAPGGGGNPNENIKEILKSISNDIKLLSNLQVDEAIKKKYNKISISYEYQNPVLK